MSGSPTPWNLMGTLSEELPRFTFLGNYLETTEEV